MYSFDESDPRFLIVHTGEEHPTPDDYRRLYARWIERLDAGDRFGLIMLNEFDHDHDDEDEEHRQQEAEFTRLLNDFRRDYRDRTAQRNTGYVTVVTEAFVEHYYDNNPDAIKTALEHLEMFAQYNWGIPGYGTTSLAEAKAWLADLHERTPQADAAPETGVREAAQSGGSVGLSYGSSTGI